MEGKILNGTGKAVQVNEEGLTYAGDIGRGYEVVIAGLTEEYIDGVLVCATSVSTTPTLPSEEEGVFHLVTLQVAAINAHRKDLLYPYPPLVEGEETITCRRLASLHADFFTKPDPRYPEHEKINANREAHQAISDFLEFQSNEGWHLGTYNKEYGDRYPLFAETDRAIGERIAAYFEVDYKAFLAEREALYRELRRGSSEGSAT